MTPALPTSPSAARSSKTQLHDLRFSSSTCRPRPLGEGAIIYVHEAGATIHFGVAERVVLRLVDVRHAPSAPASRALEWPARRGPSIAASTCMQRVEPLPHPSRQRQVSRSVLARAQAHPRVLLGKRLLLLPDDGRCASGPIRALDDGAPDSVQTGERQRRHHGIPWR